MCILTIINQKTNKNISFPGEKIPVLFQVSSNYKHQLNILLLILSESMMVIICVKLTQRGLDNLLQSSKAKVD